MDCAFCAILQGRAEGVLVAESEAAVALVDLRQAVPGHVLVLPRRHVETLFDLDEADAAGLMRLAWRVARGLRAAFAPEGLNLWQSNGEAGGQEVPHVQLHVQPRRTGDGLLRVYPGRPPPPAPRAQREAIAARIRAGLEGVGRP